MEVLQTSPLDLLGTAPQSNEYSETRVPLLVVAPGCEICSCPCELPQKRELDSRYGEGDFVEVAGVLGRKNVF